MAANGTALPVLRTPRLVIRPLGDADEDACRSVLAVPDEDGYRALAHLGRGGPGGARRPASSRPTASEPSCSRRQASWSDWSASCRLGPFDQLEGAPPGGRGRRSSASTGRSPPRIAVRLRDGSGRRTVPGALRRSPSQAAHRDDRANEHGLAGGDAPPRHDDAREPPRRAGVASGRGRPRLRARPGGLTAAQAGGACGWLAVIARPSSSLKTGSSARPLERMWWSWRCCDAGGRAGRGWPSRSRRRARPG